jgi:hypothetical protein
MEIDFDPFYIWLSNQWWSPIFYFIGSLILFSLTFSLFMEYYRERIIRKKLKEGIVVTLKVSLFYFPLMIISCLIVIIPFVVVIVIVFGGI